MPRPIIIYIDQHEGAAVEAVVEDEFFVAIPCWDMPSYRKAFLEIGKRIGYKYAGSAVDWVYIDSEGLGHKLSGPLDLEHGFFAQGYNEAREQRLMDGEKGLVKHA